MRPFNDVTVVADSLPGGLQNVTKHVLHGMVLGEITDGHHLPQHATGSATHALWQENLTSLSRVNPRAAASRVRQMFSGPRRDHTHLVRWPHFSSSEPSGTDIVEQWRQHFVSVGSQSSGVFDEDFHDDVTRRFPALFAGPHHTGGQFDGPFSVAELVGALSRCAESAVGGDGLPYSLFKVTLPWWRSALLNLFNLCLHWNDVPTMWKHSVIVPVFKNRRPLSSRQLPTDLFGVMLLQSVGAYGPFQNSSSHLAAVAPLPGRFPLGCKHDGWLSDRRVAHAVCHPHFRRGHLQGIRHLLGGSDDGGVVLHGGPRAHVGLDCTFCAWDVLAGQKWCRFVRALAGLRYCPGQSAVSVALQHSR